MSDTKKIITDDDRDFYWDTLYLADELYDQGKYEEAEELYKKIANEEDVFGDASAHYGYLLDKMGRYEEAYACFCQALKGDTSPSEGVEVFLNDSMQDEDSPYWHWHYRYIDRRLIRYLETCESIGKKPDVERILFNCLKSKDELCVGEARVTLIQIYGTGKLALFNYDEGNYEVVDVAEPDLEKLKTVVAEAVKDEDDVASILSCLCYDPENVDEALANALEAALLAVQSDEARTSANDSLFDLYFLGAVYSPFEDVWYEISFMEDQHKAAELLLKMDVEATCMYMVDFREEIVPPVLEEAHKMAPNRADVAFHLLMYVDADRFAELIRGLSDDCARALIVEGYAKALYELSLFDDEDEYFETYYLALLDFLCKYDPEGEYCDAVKKMMLNAYQFGDVYVADAVTLTDPEKAKAFAKKYGMELLSEPLRN